MAISPPYDEHPGQKRTGQHAGKQFFPFTAFWQRLRKSPETPLMRRFAENPAKKLVSHLAEFDGKRPSYP
jgi:hypothetical protein